MRHILHADFDAFYASVEQLDNPELRGKPLAVGGSPDSRGVVASASYEARKYGVRSAMPMRTAFNICPHLQRVSARFDRYRDVSHSVMAIFRDITPLVEPLSLDEAYLDVTDSVSGGQSAADLAGGLKRRVKQELGLTISVGAGVSKSVAKIASDLEKPDGLTVVPPGEEVAFLAPLPVGTLPGVGPKTQESLKSHGILTIGDLANGDDKWLLDRFGRNGAYIKSLALAKDDRPVQTHRDTKSISSETTLVLDTGDPEALHELVSRLSSDVSRSLERRDLQGRTVKLKLRLSDFTTFTRQVTLPDVIQSSDQIAVAANRLMDAETGPGRSFRLVGVGVSGFGAPNHSLPTLQPRLPGI
ncbi:MAG: DNA polymerase IV [Dehalococcoidia bacterium]|nr:DNA polymerase IV [Dehalococcoidia bacterium]